MKDIDPGSVSVSVQLPPQLCNSHHRYTRSGRRHEAGLGHDVMIGRGGVYG